MSQPGGRGAREKTSSRGKLGCTWGLGLPGPSTLAPPSLPPAGRSACWAQPHVTAAHCLQQSTVQHPALSALLGCEVPHPAPPHPTPPRPQAPQPHPCGPADHRPPDVGGRHRGPAARGRLPLLHQYPWRRPAGGGLGHLLVQPPGRPALGELCWCGGPGGPRVGQPWRLGRGPAGERAGACTSAAPCLVSQCSLAVRPLAPSLPPPPVPASVHCSRSACLTLWASGALTERLALCDRGLLRLQGWPAFTRLAYSAAAMKCIESWSFSLCTLLAGWLPDPDSAVAAIGVAFNVSGERLPGCLCRQGWGAAA